MNKNITAIYPGTFDPITYGHLSIIFIALKLFSKIIIALPNKSRKSCLFSIEERVSMIKNSIDKMMTKRVSVNTFDNLLVDYATEMNATAIIRGLRNENDYRYESNIALINRKLNKEIETIFVQPCAEKTMISSSMVKEIAYCGASVSEFVPHHVAQFLKEKVRS